MVTGTLKIRLSLSLKHAKQITQICVHLTKITIGGGEGGREAKMESGHTFLCFFVEPFPYILYDLRLISVVQLEGTIALADLA